MSYDINLSNFVFISIVFKWVRTNCVDYTNRVDNGSIRVKLHVMSGVVIEKAGQCQMVTCTSSCAFINNSKRRWPFRYSNSCSYFFLSVSSLANRNDKNKSALDGAGVRWKLGWGTDTIDVWDQHKDDVFMLNANCNNIIIYISQRANGRVGHVMFSLSWRKCDLITMRCRFMHSFRSRCRTWADS